MCANRFPASNGQRQWVGLAVLLGTLLGGVELCAQRPVHYWHAADLPPGTVAQEQLLRHPSLRGYVQPVEILLPEGARVSLNIGGGFDEPQAGPVVAGMHVGYVYQLKISNIAFQEGFEVFPTLEVIGAICPPEGKAVRFPVPIQFTQEELEMALDGRFVTRVVYLEDRDTALPMQDDPSWQRYYEVAPDQDPLRAADNLGRPLLIMRMGSRVPDVAQPLGGVLATAPPVVIYPPESAHPGVPGESSRAIERSGVDIPRVQVPRNGRPEQIPQAMTAAP